MLHDIWLAMLQLPNFNSLAFVSLVAAVMSVTYSTIGWTTAVADGRIPGGCVTSAAAVKMSRLLKLHVCDMLRTGKAWV